MTNGLLAPTRKESKIRHEAEKKLGSVFCGI